MTQDALFYDDLRGALRHLVAALGGAKRVGALLRPTLSLGRAENWVNDCLNPNRDTKFDLEDLAAVLRAGRDTGVHCAFWQLCDEAKYQRPDIATPLTDAQKIAARRVRAALELAQIADEEAALDRAKTMREVRTVAR